MKVPGGFLVAAACGNDSRFINHSCCGNAVPTVWTVHGEFRMGVFAAKGIRTGEEVKMDYSWEHLEVERIACNCGEPEGRR
jgi:SET domain-containing protein